LAAVEVQVVIQESNVILGLDALELLFLGSLSLIGVLGAILTVRFAEECNSAA